MTTRSGRHSETSDSLGAIVRASLEIDGGPVPASFMHALSTSPATELPSGFGTVSWQEPRIAAVAAVSGADALCGTVVGFDVGWFRWRRPLSVLTRQLHAAVAPWHLSRIDIPTPR